MFKKKFLAIWIVALLVLSVGSYAVISHYIHARRASTTIKQQQAAGNRIKQQVADAAKNNPIAAPTPNTPNTATKSGQTPPPSTASNPPASNGLQSVAMSITALNQTSTTLQIRTQINTVTSEGTCNLSLTNGTQTVTRTSGVQALASVSTCQGFDVPLSSLPPGNWTAQITFSNTTSTGNVSKQITIH